MQDWKTLIILYLQEDADPRNLFLYLKQVNKIQTKRKKVKRGMNSIKIRAKLSNTLFPNATKPS